MIKLTEHQKKVVLILFIFIIIRIPIALLDKNLWLINDIGQGFKSGYIIYCETEKFPSSGFFLDKNYPPGLYLYVLTMYFLFQNFLLIVLELVNLFLVYNIIKKNYGKKAALNSITFITFFPISIMNTGFTIDPIQVSLLFILLSYIFFTRENPIISAICLSLGTLIIYIPAIMMIPILIYYLKNHQIRNSIEFLIFFFLTIIICILPFLITCPDAFIQSIFNSLSQTQTLSYLQYKDFIISPLLSINILEIQILSIEVGINTLNLIQIISIIVVILILLKKFEFNREKDVIYSVIILILAIKVMTFVIHFRFLYWICILSLLAPYLSRSENLSNITIILLGFLNIIFTILILFLSFQINLDVGLIYLLQGGIILILPTLSFIIFAINLSKDKEGKPDFMRKNSFYSILFIFYFLVFLIIEITLTDPSFIVLLNIFLIILMVLEIYTIISYVNRVLLQSYKVMEDS